MLRLPITYDNSTNLHPSPATTKINTLAQFNRSGRFGSAVWAGSADSGGQGFGERFVDIDFRFVSCTKHTVYMDATIILLNTHE